MANAENERERFSLKRWSQRKLDTARVQLANASPNAPLADAPSDASALSDLVAPKPPLASDPDRATLVGPAARPDRSTPAASAVETPLPPVDSLTFDSDFRGFLQPKVDEAVKRAALKKLFNDPRFNVMDRLDVYIDDYSKPDPLPREWLNELASAQNILNPPQTRVNDQGFAEDVPPEGAATEIESVAPEETPAASESAPATASIEATRIPIAATGVAVDPNDATRAPIVGSFVAGDPLAAADDANRSSLARKPG